MRILTLACDCSSVAALLAWSTGHRVRGAAEVRRPRGVVDADADVPDPRHGPRLHAEHHFPRSTIPTSRRVIDYVKQTRDGFLNVAKMPGSRDMPYELDTTATGYSSALPPRGTQ